ncbi:MAG: ABC transporter ATP-binding protein ['Conium maculatum' witches'-broom phytoplasma]|nr:ABC transporter ATP-binding protein ['Conium maculatum' witches'-broom phytoplasma]
MSNLIELKNINKVIDSQIILKDINLEIKTNEFVTLLGPSGCGKTTILKIIGGFDDFSSGDILFNNQSIVDVPPHKRLINTVFQKYALFPHLNVLENIAFGLKIKDLNYETNQKIKALKNKTQQEVNNVIDSYQEKIMAKTTSKLTWLQRWFKVGFGPEIKALNQELKEKINLINQEHQKKLTLLKKDLLTYQEKDAFIKKTVMHYLKLVGLKGFENRDINRLSGGQQQRVAIARALINKPKVLLLDEPLAALDLKLRQEMQYELKEIQRNSGITFIFVTHDQEEALALSDKIVVLKQGEIQQIGTPQDIYNEPANKFIAQFIGESNLIPGVMKKDFLVWFDDKEFVCVDRGFDENQKVDVVIRPEDIDIIKWEDGLIQGAVQSVLFKGVYWEVIINTKHRQYLIHTTDFVQVDSKVGITFNPEDLHIMEVW